MDSQTTKFTIIDNFCNNVLSDKKYIRHSDIDLYVNIKLTGIMNYNNLLTEDDREFINKNFSKNYKYINEIETNKQQVIEEKRKQAMYMQNKKEKSTMTINEDILNFKFPQFEVYFTVRLVINGIVIEPEVLTDLILNADFNELITIRYKYKDLPYDVVLAINLYSMQLPTERCLLASTTINLFDSNFNLLQGKHIFGLYPKVEADYKPKSKTNGADLEDKIFKELDRLVYTFNSTSNNYSTVQEKESDIYYLHYQEKIMSLLSKTENSFLEVSFPVLNIPVIYEEEKNPVYKTFYRSITLKSSSNTFIKYDNWVCDPELRINKKYFSKDNPVTEKFLILSQNSDEVFTDVKPKPEENSKIEDLINTPDFIKLEDSDLILFWKYRYYLLNKAGCLPKILVAVKWGDQKSENEFLLNILKKWTNIQVGDILFMLSFKFCMNNLYSNKVIHPKLQEVRSFAVKSLEAVENKELNFILLQLVQALRYEDLNPSSELRKYLIDRCKKDINLATSLYWFLNVEAEMDIPNNKKSIGSNQVIKFYQDILIEFKSSLEKHIDDQINSQITLRNKMISNALDLDKYGSAKDRKNRLISITKKDGANDMSKFHPQLQLPLNPEIILQGIIADQSQVFKSAKKPVKYTCKVAPESNISVVYRDDPSLYDIIFKYDDDLRKDQLILQIISYIDSLLKRVGMDFEFTKYKALATSKFDGFVEFVSNSNTITNILAENTDQIRPYIIDLAKKKNQNPDAFLDSYVNSCAGYAVVTYILGIGDRHLDNILIDQYGKLFHIDFGYILGKDPKAFPPPIKLSKHMVECMGGKDSKTYENFKKKCVDTYIYLRQHARLIVNMFFLMIHSEIKELSENYETVLNKLHEKFCPGMSQQEASNSLLNKIEESVNAIYAAWMDTVHNWATYFR